MIEEPIENNVYKPEASKLLTKKKAAKYLGISEYAIKMAVESGALKKCENLGIRTWYFTNTHLEDFIKRLSEGEK